ncbi:unnamed protein product [Parnassius apollo]|uniref:(apollo) hypothetical protein n=1 Tax=Parnassius apollo TaxID=110799 RepID=A0A8S3X3R3_PARAO|nr:unnamed protein product [Parnassius apollo]
MGRYKIKLRSKRWQVRMFYHFLDLVMSNAWLLYKRVYKTKNTNGPLLSSADFREEIGTVLCKMGIKAHVQRRSIEPDIQAIKRKGPAVPTKTKVNKPGSVVVKLCQPLLNKGRSVVVKLSAAKEDSGGETMSAAFK